MAVWTLEHIDSVGASTTRELGGSQQESPGGWGFRVARRVDRSLATDVVSLEIIPDHFDSPLEPRANAGDGWKDGDQVVIYRDGWRWFSGELRREKRQASGNRHSIGWEVLGPWHAMEELTYLQFYGMRESDGNDPPGVIESYVERGDVTLMQELDQATGNVKVLTTGQQINALARFAAARTGVDPIFTVSDLANQSGSNEEFPMDNGIYVNFVEATDETVANLIRKLARWTPESVGWFDYGASPPRFHFAKPDPSAVVNIDMDEDISDLSNSGIDIQPNYDLQVPYVKIAYVSTDQVTVDGNTNSYTNVQYDTFPVDADENTSDHRKALRATVPLQGATAQVQVQKVGTRTIPISTDLSNKNPQPGPDPPAGEIPYSDAWNDRVRKFCEADDRLPWLKTVVPTGDSSSNIAVMDFTVSKMQVDDEVSYPEGGEPPVYELWETPRVLEDGATAEWMNVKTQKVKVQATLAFKGASIRAKNVKVKFNRKNAVINGRAYKTLTAEWTVTATSAVSKSYEQTTSQTEAEEMPQNIARHMYEQLENLKYTGSVTLDADELPLRDEDGNIVTEKGYREDVNAFRPGMPLNIINSLHPEWSSMATPIQEVIQSIHDRKVILRVGAPNQLGINDFVKLARLWRDNPPSFTNDEGRATGRAEGSGKTVGGERTPSTGGSDDEPVSEDNPFSIKAGPERNSDNSVNPSGFWKVTVEPGIITSERTPLEEGNNEAPEYKPITPKINGVPLDATNQPHLTMTAMTEYVYIEHVFSGAGVLESAEVKLGAEVPEGDGTQTSKEYLEIGKVEILANDKGDLEDLITQEVECNYYWPGKVKLSLSGGTVTTEEFYIVKAITVNTPESQCTRFALEKVKSDFTNFSITDPEKNYDLANCESIYDPPETTEIEVADVTYLPGDPSSECGALQIDRHTISVPVDGIKPPSYKPSFLLCTVPSDSCEDVMIVSGSTLLDTEVNGIYNRVQGVQTWAHESSTATIDAISEGWQVSYSKPDNEGGIHDYVWKLTPEQECPPGVYTNFMWEDDQTAAPGSEVNITVTASP